jgi:hypothetical protein
MVIAFEGHYICRTKGVSDSLEIDSAVETHSGDVSESRVQRRTSGTLLLGSVGRFPWQVLEME